MATAALSSDAPMFSPAAAATPDQLASEADFDQLPSSPGLEHAGPVADEVGEGDEEEEEGGEEEEEDGEEVASDEDDLEEAEETGKADTAVLDGQDAATDAGEAMQDGGEGEQGTEAAGTAAEEPDEDELPTVLIEFEGSLFDLFAQQAGGGKLEGVENAIPLKAPPDILEQPLSTLFTTLRIPDALGEFLDKDMHLVLRSPEVDLEVAENDLSAREVLLQDFLDVHPATAQGAVVRLKFFQRQPFLARFKALGGIISQPIAVPQTPATAVSSWTSGAKSNLRRVNGGDEEPDELDEDGVLGEHHEPEADDEAREAEWEEGDGEVHEHWDGDEEDGQGEEEEDGDVDLVDEEDGEDDPNSAVDEEGEGGEDDEDNDPDDEGDDSAYEEGAEDVGSSGGHATATTNEAPTGQALETSKSSPPTSVSNGDVQATAGPNDEYDDDVPARTSDNVEDSAGVNQPTTSGLSSSLTRKRSFDEVADASDTLPAEDDGSKRVKV